ncbi:MAG: SagB/ThcOx family dehydrogenase [Aigarchaeota archaeon]|nr:SagB/ThcOx family dehydrogenase [Candidatus Pelearchaeum maunauluense]
MSNRDITTALEFHELTKHSYTSVRTSTHRLDLHNRPYPFKVYLEAKRVELPREFPKPSLPTLEALAGKNLREKRGELDIAGLAEILYFSAGITRVLRNPLGEFYFRAAPATGALYPIELYIVSGDIPGLRAGVYHFDPGEFILNTLREGDYRDYLSRAAGEEQAVRDAPATVVMTSIAWRNAWKYQVRSYRHWFWDSGVIAANMLAVSVSEMIGARVIMGFVDEMVNKLLCVGGSVEEAAIALIPLAASAGEKAPKKRRRVSQEEHKTMPLSRYIINYPAIWQMHKVSSLTSVEEVKEWRGQRVEQVEDNYEGETYKLEGWDDVSSPPLWETILKRGSTRRFAQKPISEKHLATILGYSTRGLDADFLNSGASLIDVYLIASSVDGIPAGAYYYDRKNSTLLLLKRGAFRRIAGYLCLEQKLGEDASVVFFLMTRLNQVLRRLGNRGYRACQFEAGVVAGRMYLAAYALGLGATGLTFYDDEITEFLSPHAREKSNMLTVAVGFPAYKARSGEILLGVVKHERRMEYPQIGRG